MARESRSYIKKRTVNIISKQNKRWIRILLTPQPFKLNGSFVILPSCLLLFCLLVPPVIIPLLSIIHLFYHTNTILMQIEKTNCVTLNLPIAFMKDAGALSAWNLSDKTILKNSRLSTLIFEVFISYFFEDPLLAFSPYTPLIDFSPLTIWSAPKE